jgi:hypothetical protein
MPINASEKQSALAADESRIVAELHQFFEQYGPTFVDLATGKRSDVDALLAFYGAPLRFIGPTFHTVMKDNAAITGPEGMGGEIERLRKATFGSSTLEKCDITVLNPRAAIVDALWVRRDASGRLMARCAVVYLIALTTDGWRITSAVNTSE